MREKGNPEPDLVSQKTEDPFQPDRHDHIIQKIAQACEDKKDPVKVQKDPAGLDIIDRSQKEENDDYCDSCLDNLKGISF
jgi:hypothetical protein